MEAIDLLTRLRRAPEDRPGRARQGARRRHPGDRALQGPARRGGRGAHRPRALRRPPPGRTVLGPEDHLRTFSRDGIVAFRERRWSGARGARSSSATSTTSRRTARSTSSSALPRPARARVLRAGAAASSRASSSSERDSNQSHLRMSYRPQVDGRRPQGSAPRFTIYATLLGGSMGSRLFDEIREQRGLCYSVYATDHAYADVPVLQLGSGLESAKAGEAYTRMREIVARAGGRRAQARGGRARARVRRRAPGPGLREHQRGGPLRGQPAIVFDEDIDPDSAIARPRRGHLRRGRRGRARRSTPRSSPWPASGRTRATSSDSVKPSPAAPSGSEWSRDGSRGPQRA